MSREICVNGAPAGSNQGRGLTENSNDVKQEVILEENDSDEYELVSRAINSPRVGKHNNQELERFEIQSSVRSEARKNRFNYSAESEKVDAPVLKFLFGGDEQAKTAMALNFGHGKNIYN
ncbi:hypothetical protein U1Q18_047254 [Sarracenia purpurea var. burkii]